MCVQSETAQTLLDASGQKIQFRALMESLRAWSTFKELFRFAFCLQDVKFVHCVLLPDFKQAYKSLNSESQTCKSNTCRRVNLAIADSAQLHLSHADRTSARLLMMLVAMRDARPQEALSALVVAEDERFVRILNLDDHLLRTYAHNSQAPLHGCMQACERVCMQGWKLLRGRRHGHSGSQIEKHRVRSPHRR
eukprot:6176441-Pleurochrysis_carterae.AAC.3